MMTTRRWCGTQMGSLVLAAVLLGIGARDASAQLISLEVGYRGRSSGNSFRPPAGPVLGLRFAPLNFGWASLGTEAFWVPSVTDQITSEWCVSMLRTGECVKRVDRSTESATQLGLSFRFGQLRNRGFFGDLGLGLYRATIRERFELWAGSDADPGPRWRPVTLIEGWNPGTSSEAGGYARIGVGFLLKLRERGPTASTSLRYRWAGTVGEYSLERNGVELVLGLGAF
jgi:hypothetical protein